MKLFATGSDAAATAQTARPQHKTINFQTTNRFLYL